MVLTKRKTFLRRYIHKTFQHWHCIFILKVIFEMEICECHIVISQIIHCFAYKFISKKCWITFYIGMNVFFFQKIRNNVFDFLRRTSMHGGKRNRVTDF